MLALLLYSGGGPAPVEVVRGGGGYRYFGYTPERKKKPKVEVKLEGKKVAYVLYTGMPSYAGLAESVEDLSKAIERYSIKSKIVRRKIEEIEDEEDIILILSQL